MCKMNCVHLKVVSFAIDGVFGPVMEMELDSSEPSVPAEPVSGDIG